MTARRLEDMAVLVIGAGGLGAPALLALGSSGVGRIGILEPDRVEVSNLHRQILYREEDLGSSKAEAAAARLSARFPSVRVEAHRGVFDRSTHDLITRFDAVLDGTDQFETKLAVSDACVDRGVDYVFAGVVGYEGQVMAVRPFRSACLRCLFEEAPPPGAAPSCAELGILGPVAGVVAAKQVSSLLALATGDASVLDQIWVYDGRRDVGRTIPLRRARDCRGCGTSTNLRGAASILETPPEEVDAPVLDLTGHVCPRTYTEARKTLERLPESGRLWIHLDSDEAARNMPRSIVAAGHRVLARRSDGRMYRVLVERR